MKIFIKIWDYVGQIIQSYTGVINKMICLRYFNIYGINQRYDLYGNVIPIFAHGLFNALPLCIYGDGSQSRDFVNVQDIAAANYLASQTPIHSDVFNMGSGGSITVKHLAELRQEITGLHTGIEFLPGRKADVKHCKADITEVKKIFKFRPSKKLEDGLNECFT